MAFIVIFCTAQLPKMHGFRATLVEHAVCAGILCETEAVDVKFKLHQVL